MTLWFYGKYMNTSLEDLLNMDSIRAWSAVELDHQSYWRINDRNSNAQQCPSYNGLTSQVWKHPLQVTTCYRTYGNLWLHCAWRSNWIHGKFLAAIPLATGIKDENQGSIGSIDSSDTEHWARHGGEGYVNSSFPFAAFVSRLEIQVLNFQRMTPHIRLLLGTVCVGDEMRGKHENGNESTTCVHVRLWQTNQWWDCPGRKTHCSMEFIFAWCPIAILFGLLLNSQSVDFPIPGYHAAIWLTYQEQVWITVWMISN